MIFYLLLALVFIPLIVTSVNNPLSWRLQLPAAAESPQTTTTRPLYREGFVHKEGLTPYVHSSSLTQLDNGSILAVWYGGSREGAGDVAIYAATLDPQSSDWNETRILTDAVMTKRQLKRYVKKLGNPVVMNDAQGKLWLFYVSVAVGGWSGSELNLMTSEDGGLNWSPAQRLISSPFLNRSTLVKGTPIFYDDGTLGLPVYHELMGKFGELLRIDAQSKVQDKARISWGRSSLQPSIVVLNETTALAMLRNSGKRPRKVWRSTSDDGGRHWSAMQATALPNPNSAVMLLPTPEDDLLLAFNNTQTGRYNLSLAQSTDQGENWRVLHAFEDHPYAKNQLRFSYPYLIQTKDGLYHLTYTWRKQRIKHIVFNHAWVEQQRKRLRP